VFEKKTFKKIAIVLSVAAIICFLYLAVSAAYFWISAGLDYTIKNGFDEPLCTMLRDEYHITVPSDAEFIKGKFFKGTNDPSITLFFKLPANGKEAGEFIDSILGAEVWSGGNGGVNEDDVESFTEMSMEHSRENTEKAYTSLHYTDVKDGYVYVMFSGWRPSMKSVDTKIDW